MEGDSSKRVVDALEVRHELLNLVFFQLCDVDQCKRFVVGVGNCFLNGYPELRLYEAFCFTLKSMISLIEQIQNAPLSENWPKVDSIFRMAHVEVASRLSLIHI